MKHSRAPHSTNQGIPGELDRTSFSSRSRRWLLIAGLTLGAGLVLAGGRPVTAGGEEPPPAPPPTQVSVVTVKPQTVKEELEVLDAQRQLFSARLGLAQVERQYLVSMIDLYRALGGGWTGLPNPRDD